MVLLRNTFRNLCHYKLRKRQTLNIISSGRKPIVRIVMKQKLGVQNENSTVQIIWINYLMILNIKEANETKSQKGNGLYLIYFISFQNQFR